MEEVEPGYRSFVARTFGDDGRRWLAALPMLQRELAARWGLSLGEELPGGLLSCVRAATTADDASAVLKLGPPWPRARHEIVSLRAWGGLGAPRLLHADEGIHAMVLERIVPGVNADPGEHGHVAAVLRAIHVPPPVGLPTLAETVHRRLDRAESEGRANAERIAWARAAAERLLDRGPEPVLVHGDFDDRNLLVCATQGLRAIDPLPCVGDPAYDAAHWVHANRRRGRRARLDAIVAATGLPHERVRDWAAVAAVHG